MKIFTYKNFPAINIEKVQYFEVMNNYEKTSYMVRFVFGHNLVDWKANNEQHAHKIYNDIIDHLDDSHTHFHISTSFKNHL